jgi:hypothetical protein
MITLCVGGAIQQPDHHDRSAKRRGFRRGTCSPTPVSESPILLIFVVNILLRYVLAADLGVKLSAEDAERTGVSPLRPALQSFALA